MRSMLWLTGGRLSTEPPDSFPGAHREKALRRGLGEDPVLTPLAEASRSALWEPPCDLDAARAAVRAYQDTLSTTIAARDAR